MRNALNRLYNAAGALAALFLVGTLIAVLAGIASRLSGLYLRGTDAYAGYSMAAAGFLALSYTLKHGEHIRVTLVLQRLHGKARSAMELIAHAIAIVVAALLAWYSLRLAWQSYTFKDISQGIDATPLWIPQIAMALGFAILLISFVDDFVLLARGRHVHSLKPATEPAHIE